MKTISIEEVYGDEIGEVTVFLEDGKLLSVVASNDGTWRDEYFNPVLAKLGVTVERSKLSQSELEALVMDWYGF